MELLKRNSENEAPEVLKTWGDQARLFFCSAQQNKTSSLPRPSFTTVPRLFQLNTSVLRHPVNENIRRLIYWFGTWYG